MPRITPIFAALVFLTCYLVAAPPATQPSQTALENEFQRTMTNATMAGHYTLGDDKPPHEDKYTITSATKVPLTDKWVITSRIQYGEHDVTVPIIVPVKWAGDTPVIEVTDLSIPGLGTYTARVLVYRDHYAGTWSGGDHGGHLYGKITHPTSAPAKP
jgi:hypothetical protein